MKVVYIAHPIGGDVANNLKRVIDIIHELNTTRTDIVPFAHYYVDCHALDDDDPVQRQRGIDNDHELLRRGFIDEMWLYGKVISKGMQAEIELAIPLGIKVVPMTTETAYHFRKMYNK